MSECRQRELWHACEKYIGIAISSQLLTFDSSLVHVLYFSLDFQIMRLVLLPSSSNPQFFFFFFFRIINFLPVLESFLSPSLSIYIDTYCGSVSKESACNEGDSGLIPASGRSPGEGNGNPLQHSCLENPMDRGAWWATVHGSEKVRHDWVTNRTHARAHTHTHTLLNSYLR